MIKKSCENENATYLSLFGKRYIFENGKYVGWYRPGRTPKDMGRVAFWSIVLTSVALAVLAYLVG